MCYQWRIIRHDKLFLLPSFWIVKLKCDANGKKLCIYSPSSSSYYSYFVVAAFSAYRRKVFNFQEGVRRRVSAKREFQFSLHSPGRSPSFSCSFTSYQSLCYVTLVGIFYLPAQKMKKIFSKYIYALSYDRKNEKLFFFSFSFHSFFMRFSIPFLSLKKSS